MLAFVHRRIKRMWAMDVLMEAPAPGPALRALDALWARHRRGWRRLLSRRAVAELTMRASFDPDLLAPWRVANRIPKGSVPDCPRCENVCCAGIENVVSLRLRDVALLLDIDRADLMTKKKPNFPAWMLRERPHLAELVASELWRALPVLRQVGEARACVALTSDLRCSLHPSWPSSCERFPYTLSAARRHVVWGTRCPERRVHPELVPRSEELFRAAIAAFNERVRDAVLLAHAKKELHAIGIGAWLTANGEDPFEARAPGLPVVE